MDKNSSIQCVVDECSFHAQGEDYCTLDNILVGKHEKNATKTECTDCESFKAKQKMY